jgi:polysaccharide export outer membrane protein
MAGVAPKDRAGVAGEINATGQFSALRGPGKRKQMSRTRDSVRLAAGAVCLAMALSCAAQQPPERPVEQNAAPDTLKPNPLTALREFEAPIDQDYTLGRGDEISIDFSGRPELSAKRIIGPDGRVTLPPAGSILIADKTREQAARIIADALEAFYTHLSVTVGVDKYTSNRVLLLGAVEHPGPVSFDAPPTLLEVLTIGGGVSRSNQTSTIPNPVGIARVAQISAAVPERCAIYRGSEQVMWVDLKGLIDSGSALADLRLKRGDIVYVPSAAERYVSVLGQVGHPGALLLDNNTTLPKLIAEAGGITQLAGRNPNIEIISPSTGKTRVIPFRSLLAPGSLELTLKSGDLIYVTESGFNQFSYVVEKLSPLVTMFTTAALLNNQ